MKNKKKNSREDLIALYKKLYKNPQDVKQFAEGGFWGKDVTDKQAAANNQLGMTAITGATTAAAAAIPDTELTAQTKKGPMGSATGAVRDGIASAIPIAGMFHGISELGVKGAQQINKGAKGEGYLNSASQSLFSPSQGITDSIDRAQSSTGKDKATAIGSVAANWVLPGLGGAIYDGIAAATGAKTPEEKAIETAKQQEVLTQNKNSKADYMQSINQGVMGQGATGNPIAMAKGGTLEQYNLPSHAAQDPNAMNSIMDGQPVQQEKNETILKGKGSEQDVAFSPNVMYEGKSMADRSKQRESKWEGKNDSISLATKKLEEKDDIRIQKTLTDSQEQKTQYSDFKKSLGGVQKMSKGGPSTDDMYATDDTRVEPIMPPMQTVKPFTGQDLIDVEKIGGNVKATSYLEGEEQEVKEKTFKLNKKTGSYETNPNLANFKNSATSFYNSGDAAQLAGVIPGTAYNFIKSLTPYDRVKANKNNTATSLQQLSPEAGKLAINQQFASFKDSLDGRGVQGKAANMAAAMSKTQGNIGQHIFKTDQANKTLFSQYQDKLSAKRQFNVGQENYAEDSEARNKAAQSNFGAKAATQFGQGVTEFGKQQGQSTNNEIGYKVLSEMYPDFTLGKKDDIINGLGTLYEFKGGKFIDKKTGKEIKK